MPVTPATPVNRRAFAVAFAAFAAHFVVIGIAVGSSTISAAEVVHPDDLRIVSLTPAVTQMLIDLGVSDAVVGVGAYDPVAPPRAQVVGDLYHIDYERLLILEPTHVFYQRTRQPLPGRLSELAAKHRWQLHGYEIEVRDDVMAALRGRDGRIGVGAAIGHADAAEQLARSIERRLARLAEVTTAAAAQRTLPLVGFNPLTAAGPGTVVNQMLTIAGGRNVIEGEEIRYPVIDRERLLALDPEVIVLIAPRQGAAAAGSDRKPRDVKGKLNLPPSMNPRIVVLDEPTALLPSTTMVATAAQLAKLLHPHLAEQIDAAVSDQALPGDPGAPPDQDRPQP